MRAVFGTGMRTVQLRELDHPSPQPGEALLRVRACGICGSDLHWFQGGFPPPPVCPGHEIAGEVVALGADARGVHVGDRVAVEPLIICGRCAACRRGDYQLCARFQLLGTVRDGGLADYVVAPVGALFAFPGGLEWDVAALAEPTAVCVHAARLVQLRVGDRVLVLGAGTIGLLAVLVAHASGASAIAISARHAHQAEMARRLGATHVFASEDDDARDRVLRDLAPDVVFETVGGNAATIDEALHAVRPGGTVVVLGIFTAPSSCNALMLVGKEVRLIGSLMYGRAGGRADFEVAIDVLAKERERVAGLITHRFGLDAVQEAFETAADKKRGAIKVTIVPE
jgi:2-desacetyl-2-hydroxyethyl bacteriochlorophyllide A dehydrogenase